MTDERMALIELIEEQAAARRHRAAQSGGSTTTACPSPSHGHCASYLCGLGSTRSRITWRRQGKVSGEYAEDRKHRGGPGQHSGSDQTPSTDLGDPPAPSGQNSVSRRNWPRSTARGAAGALASKAAAVAERGRCNTAAGDGRVRAGATRVAASNRRTMSCIRRRCPGSVSSRGCRTVARPAIREGAAVADGPAQCRTPVARNRSSAPRRPEAPAPRAGQRLRRTRRRTARQRPGRVASPPSQGIRRWPQDVEAIRRQQKNPPDAVSKRRRK